MRKLDFGKIFDYYDLRSEYLKKMLEMVLLQINRSVDIFDEGFGSIHEGSTSSGEAGEVTEDGTIYLDSYKLNKYEEDVAMAIIAHELSHYYLNHYKKPTNTLEHEYEADELARKWGFNIDEFRVVCGPPT